MKFFLMMLLSSAMFIACGDDVDTEFVEEVVERRVGDIDRASSDGVILDAEEIFGGDTSVDQAIEETIRDARNGDFDLDIDELSSSIDFPVVGDYLDDYRLAFYDLHYQCFERGNSRSRGTIESRRDGNRQLATNNLRSSLSRTATGCNMELLFSGGVRCLGSLRYSGLSSSFNNDRWDSGHGNTDLKWVCAMRDRDSTTRRLDYSQHVRCRGSLSEPPNDSQIDDCRVRFYDFDLRRYSSWSTSRAEDALYDAAEHLDDIHSENWNENCCRDRYGYSQNYREIFEVGTIVMKKSMMAIWSRADEFLQN